MAKSCFCLLIYSMAFISFTGCLTNVEDITGSNIPAEVTYSKDIQPIFSASCAGSGCHIPNATNGVALSSYAAVINSVGQTYGTHIIKPFDAEGSPLVDKIEPNPTHGARMPLTGGYLNADDIARIKAWINAGASEN